ncbi:exonuclease subunit SbcD [Halosquirtibacter xylanolyticus]|uniref:exonuclease subunit SbcD n=1 Tax=Halosquirtibacter xylanolyticus TaxID=3374599 RepID=UPI003749164B|nr:exonuclease subunit SbcD [Prolixibacteraceae bacterium]
MKILHTSDWHIGHRLQLQDRTEEHKNFFHWLIQTINKEEVDVLIVSGDIFDIGYPSNQMLHLYYHFLLELKDSFCKRVIITGGNHDQASTLNAPKEILKALNIDIVGGMPNEMEKEIIRIETSNPERPLVIIATPFLRDREIRKSSPGESFETKMKATALGIATHYREAVDHILEDNTISPTIIAMGHLLVTGVSMSDSEREIHIGSLQGVPIDKFPPEIDYFALGHIHRPQKIQGNDHIRYCGSPIPLSFSEHKDIKKVILVDIDDSDGNISTKELETPKLRYWKRTKGTLAEVQLTLQQHQSELEKKDWFEIQVIEPTYDPNIISTYESWLESERETDQYKIIKESLQFDQNENITSERDQYTKDLSEMTIKEVFTSLIVDKGIEDDELLLQTLNELLQDNPTLLD